MDQTPWPIQHTQSSHVRQKPANAFWQKIFTCKAIKGFGDTCDPQLQSPGQGGRGAQPGRGPSPTPGPANRSAASPHYLQVWTLQTQLGSWHKLK